ncbi:MAG: hypothetical protein Q9159_002777 [Coniocarpon cinnabarinum]
MAARYLHDVKTFVWSSEVTHNPETWRIFTEWFASLPEWQNGKVPPKVNDDKEVKVIKEKSITESVKQYPDTFMERRKFATWDTFHPGHMLPAANMKTTNLGLHQRPYNEVVFNACVPKDKDALPPKKLFGYRGPNGEKNPIVSEYLKDKNMKFGSRV